MEFERSAARYPNLLVRVDRDDLDTRVVLVAPTPDDLQPHAVRGARPFPARHEPESAQGLAADFEGRAAPGDRPPVVRDEGHAVEGGAVRPHETGAQALGSGVEHDDIARGEDAQVADLHRFACGEAQGREDGREAAAPCSREGVHGHDRSTVDSRPESGRPG